MQIKPGVYRHYKGKKYRVIGLAKLESSLEDMVVYETLYKNPVSKLWIRPINDFVNKVEVKGKKISHFQYIGE